MKPTRLNIPRPKREDCKYHIAEKVPGCTHPLRTRNFVTGSGAKIQLSALCMCCCHLFEGRAEK